MVITMVRNLLSSEGREVKNKMANLSHSPEVTVVKKKSFFFSPRDFLMQDKHIFKLFLQSTPR